MLCCLQVPLPQQLQHLSYDALQFTLVDCPGHASLIRTIIGGAQIIDMMVLVIDVTKGKQLMQDSSRWTGACRAAFPATAAAAAVTFLAERSGIAAREMPGICRFINAQQLQRQRSFRAPSHVHWFAFAILQDDSSVLRPPLPASSPVSCLHSCWQPHNNRYLHLHTCCFLF